MTASARRSPAAFLVSSTVAKVYLALVLVAAAYPTAAWTLGAEQATGWEHLWLFALTFPGQLVALLLPDPVTSAMGVFGAAAVGALIVLTVVGAIDCAVTRHRALRR